MEFEQFQNQILAPILSKLLNLSECTFLYKTGIISTVWGPVMIRGRNTQKRLKKKSITHKIKKENLEK